MSENGGIRVLKRGIAVLNCIASENRSLGVTEISNSTGLSKTTVHRILATFLDSNVLIKDSSGTYQIGPSVLIWGDAYGYKSGLIEISRPFIEDISSDSQETVHLFSYENGSAYYIYKKESSHPVGMKSRIGSRINLYCTAAGRAILASLPKDELMRYFAEIEMKKRTPSTITDREDLIHLLERVREAGFAEENQENEEGIRCLASVILDHKGYPVGAMSLSAPAYRFSSEERDIFGPDIRDKAQLISTKLGYRNNFFQEAK